MIASVGVFQSTLPARGATQESRYSSLAERHISIHAPREGSDCKSALSTGLFPVKLAQVLFAYLSLQIGLNTFSLHNFSFSGANCPGNL
jgi:hypothetical protein